MSDSQMLQGKRAVIFGAGDSIGAAVASEFARKARRFFWLGDPVERGSRRSTYRKGGSPRTGSAIDALGDAAVNTYIDNIVRDAGQVDIVFTAVGALANEYGNTNMPRTSQLTNSCCRSQRSKCNSSRRARQRVT